MKKALIQSPLNYTGGKYRLLPQILPLFPKSIDTFVDLFCGGANVGINIDCKHIILNDIDQNVIGLLNVFKSYTKEEILQSIYATIEKYELSDTIKKKYSDYNCNSSNGLAKYNRDKYLNLRRDFNGLIKKDYDYYIMLYVLIVYSFNNQIRFNKQNEFNLPVGKRDFNRRMLDKLSNFIKRLQNNAYLFSNVYFDEFDINSLSNQDFVYCDPPYLITCATYNENNLWNEIEELRLLNFLDRLTEQGIRFALSNVLKNKGKENEILLSWLSEKRHYNCHNLNYSYANSNYQIKKRNKDSQEVLITNYSV